MMTMTQAYGKWILWGLVVLAVLVLSVALFWPSNPAEVPQPVPTLPNASSTGHTSNPEDTLSLTGKLGTVSTDDFLHNGLTEADPLN